MSNRFNKPNMLKENRKRYFDNAMRVGDGMTMAENARLCGQPELWEHE